MDAKISVEVGAKIDELTSKMAQAEKSVANFADKAGVKLDKYAKDGGQSLKSFSNGSNQAAFALTNLGRVAQDAPFGFIGIQNNLNPLLESFQRLRQESGSNVSALKALGQSLIGPAGIGVALSLVSAGIIIYQQWQQKANKVTENAKKATDDYVKSLDQVTQSQVKGAQNATAELTNLKLLYAATQDVSLSSKQRADAVDNLQQKYPAYFKNISDEAILAGKAEDAYIRLSTAILATARARAAEELIATNTKRQLENEQKVVDLNIELAKEQQKAEKAKAIANASIGAAGQEGTGSITAENNRIKALKQVEEVQAQINNIKTDSNILEKRNLDLVKEVNKEIAKGADLSGNVGGNIGGGSSPEKSKKSALQKQLKNAENSLRDSLINARYIVSQNNADLLKGFGDNLKRSYDKETKQFKDSIQTDKPLIDLPAIVGATGLSFDTAFDKMLARAAEFNEQISQVLTYGVIDGIGGIASAIGESLAAGTNVLQAVGGSLLSSFGDIMIQLGKIAIGTAIGIEAIKTALKTLNPVVAVAAGVALIALGSFVKGKVSALGGGQSGPSSGTRKIPGFASGVQNFNGGLALVGERGPELVNLPKGSDVIPNGQIGGLIGNGGSQVFIADTILEGNQIRIVYNRATALASRNGS